MGHNWDQLMHSNAPCLFVDRGTSKGTCLVWITVRFASYTKWRLSKRFVDHTSQKVRFGNRRTNKARYTFTFVIWEFPFPCEGRVSTFASIRERDMLLHSSVSVGAAKTGFFRTSSWRNSSLTFWIYPSPFARVELVRTFVVRHRISILMQRGSKNNV